MSNEPLTADQLEAGDTYRGKKPRRVGEQYDDRTILYVGMRTVQYDSVNVAQGRRFPSVSTERFLQWASHKVDAEQA